MNILRVEKNKADHPHCSSGKFSEFAAARDTETGYYPNAHGQQTLNGTVNKEAVPRSSEQTAVHNA